MKKLLTIALLFVAATTFAQKGSAVKLPLAIGDTLTNTGTVTKTLNLTGGYNGTSITVHCKVLSGTGAGTVVISGTNDGGTNPVYTAIGSSYTITNVADNGITFYVTSPLPQKIKILATGSGTESTIISVWYRTPIFQNQ